MLSFNELEVKQEILDALKDMGFEEATPIQELAIPIALSGADVIGQAQTGTGKTAAFSIPFLQMIAEEPVVQVLILTPTRELCMQIEKEVKKISKYLRLKSVAVYGGQDINFQIRALKARPQVIVATPGRLMDHMNRHTIRLDNLKMVVLDEADEMLNMGFLEDIETILATCPEERQTMMFSATMRPEIKAIANKFMKEPQIVAVKAKELTVPSIEQVYYEIPEQEKFKLLCRLLDIYNPELAMVFGRTKRRVDEVTMALQKMGYPAEGLHGDLSQRQRDMVMNKFRNGQIRILVATDVAARGLDVTGVSHVINFDLPQEIDNYVHRIGRTGRAGNDGIALTFVEPREVAHMRLIEQTIKKKVTKAKIPSARESRQKKMDALYGSIADAVNEGNVLDYQELANDLVQEFGSVDALAAVLEMMAGDSARDAEISKIKLTAERPIFVKYPERRQEERGGKGGYLQRHLRKGGPDRQDGFERGHGQKEWKKGKENGYSKENGKKKDFKNHKKHNDFNDANEPKDYRNLPGKHSGKGKGRDGKKGYKKSAE